MSHSAFSPSHLLLYTRRFLKNDQLILGFLSVIVGLVGGGLVIVLREGILFFQNLFYGAPDERLYDYVRTCRGGRWFLCPRWVAWRSGSSCVTNCPTDVPKASRT